MSDPEPWQTSLHEAQKEIARLKAENEWVREQRDLAIETAEVSQAGWQAAVDALTRVSRAFAAAMKGTDA